MSRWIDGEEAFNLLADAPQAIVPKVIWKAGIRSILDQCNAIDIVRCKDCKHWCKGDDVYGICYRCPNTRQMRYDDFCSRGEREGE